MSITLAPEVLNGHLPIPAGQSPADVVAALPKKQQRYVQELNNDIAGYMLAEQVLAEEIRDADAEIKASAAYQRKQQLQGQLKQAKALRHEAVLLQRGVIESHLAEERPGTKLSDIVSESIPVKQIKRGRPRKEA